MPTYEPGRVLLRRATAAEWAATNPVLGPGELGIVINGDGSFGSLKIGDGSSKWTDLPAYEGTEGPQGEQGPAGQDGALTLSLADNSLVNTGTATNPVLKVGDLSATYASAAQLASLSAQQGQLMGVAATIDELTVSHTFEGRWSLDTWIRTITAHALPKYTFWVAPYACQVTTMAMMFDFTAQAVDASNYISVSLLRFRDNAEDTIVSKSSADEAIAIRTVWGFAGATWDTNSATLQAGDGIALTGNVVGTAALEYPFNVTCTVQPT